MAKAQTDYNALVRKLRQEGPGRLYLLYGEEDYLRESFFGELKKLCLDGGADEFNYRRLSAAGMALDPLLEAIEALPFLGERTLVELCDFDINKCRDKNAEIFKNLDIPEYCTLVIILRQGYEPDGRLSVFKSLKQAGEVIEFTPQAQSELTRWIYRRFEALGKTIDRTNAEHLIFLSGGLMGGLLQDIEKLAAYSKGPEISRGDIDAVVTRLPEAEVFEMSDRLAQGNFDAAASVLSELLEMRESPTRLLSIIGQQFRSLFAARFALDSGLDRGYIMEVSGIRYDSIARKLIGAARGFSLEQLADILEYCAETDYKMKSTGIDDAGLLMDLLFRVALRKAGAFK